MNRYPNLHRINAHKHAAIENPQAVPGAGLDVLLAVASRPTEEGKTWLWLVEMRVHLGKVTRCHSAGFAIAPPGDLSMAIPVNAPNGDTVDQFLAGAQGYAVINRNLDQIALGGINDDIIGFVIAGLGMMAEEPGAIDDLIHWHERAEQATPSILDIDAVAAGMAEATICPGLGPVALGQALNGELLYTEHRHDLALIERDEEIAHVHLGANDNLPHPEVCTEPPEFEELGS